MGKAGRPARVRPRLVALTSLLVAACCVTGNDPSLRCFAPPPPALSILGDARPLWLAPAVGRRLRARGVPAPAACQMAANGGGARGGSKNKKKKKAAKVRADVLLVERGLAAHANEAMALILKKLVVADEGKIIVDKAGSLLPQDVPLRIKGRTGSAAVARAPPASAAGVVLGEEVCGTVVAHHGSRVLVEQGLGEEGAGDDGRRERCSCSLTPALKRVGVVTGDHVRYAPIVEGDESAGMRGVIAARLERKTVLARPTKALADVKEEDLEALGAAELLSNMGARKVICANVDQAVFVFAPKPSSTLLLLDSYIVACTESGIRPVIVFNKCDLLLEEGGGDGMVEGEEGVDGAAQERVLGRKVKGGASTGLLGPEFFHVYRELGHAVMETSTRSGEGIEELQQALSGRSSIFIGQSGVGKSSLLNALMPRDVMKVACAPVCRPRADASALSPARMLTARFCVHRTRVRIRVARVRVSALQRAHLRSHRRARDPCATRIAIARASASALMSEHASTRASSPACSRRVLTSVPAGGCAVSVLGSGRAHDVARRNARAAVWRPPHRLRGLPRL